MSSDLLCRIAPRHLARDSRRLSPAGAWLAYLPGTKGKEFQWRTAHGLREAFVTCLIASCGPLISHILIGGSRAVDLDDMETGCTSTDESPAAVIVREIQHDKSADLAGVMIENLYGMSEMKLEDAKFSEFPFSEFPSRYQSYNHWD